MNGKYITTLVAIGALGVCACGGSNDQNGSTDDSGTGGDGTYDSNGGDSSTDARSDSSSEAPYDSTLDGYDGGTDADAGPIVVRTTPTNGSAIAMSKDEKVAVAVNRTAGSVSVFPLNFSSAATPIGKPT